MGLEDLTPWPPSLKGKGESKDNLTPFPKGKGESKVNLTP